VKIKSMFLVAF